MHLRSMDNGITRSVFYDFGYILCSSSENITRFVRLYYYLSSYTLISPKMLLIRLYRLYMRFLNRFKYEKNVWISMGEISDVVFFLQYIWVLCILLCQKVFNQKIPPNLLSFSFQYWSQVGKWCWWSKNIQTWFNI